MFKHTELTADFSSEDIMRRIKGLRQSAGITQTKMAELICVTQPVMSHYESCFTRPSLTLLLSVVKLFKVSLDWLVYGDDTELKVMHLKEFKIDGVVIFSALEDFTKDEAGRYLEYVNEHGTFNHEEFKVSEINIVPCDDGKIDVNYTLKTKKKFERIRRITGE